VLFKRLNSEAGNLYLRGLLLNNDARKSEAIELFASALPAFARLIAIEFDVPDGTEHDLVADYLLQHHFAALKMLNIPGSNHLVPFMHIYKRVHNLPRPMELLDAVYARYFPTDVAGSNDTFEIEELDGNVGDVVPEQSVDGSISTLTESTSTNTAATSKSTAPAKSRPNSTSVITQTSAAKSTSDGEKGNSKTRPTIKFGNKLLDKTDFVTALNVLKRQSKDNCLIAMLEEAADAITTPNTEGATPSQGHAVTISSQQSTAPGTASTLNSNPPQTTPKGSHSSTKAAISLCLHPNNKSIVFSRQPKPEEFDDTALIEMLRRELCGRIAACDSIRTLTNGQTVDATIYNNPPGLFNTHRTKRKLILLKQWRLQSQNNSCSVRNQE
jgi:hypothetical protein